MMIEELTHEQKAKRLEELNRLPFFTDEERSEWIELQEELTPTIEDIHECEPIEAIKEERKLEPLKKEALRLEMERKKLELEDRIKSEKTRIEKLKYKLRKGLIYCDECKKDMPPSHFD